MKNPFTAVLSLLFMMVCCHAAAQKVQNTDDPLQEIFVKQNSFSQFCPLEKAYLHFDKPYYMTGETIYFKAYGTLGYNFIPDTMSRTLHVEMLDSRGSQVHALQLELQYGCSAGTIDIPENYEPGIYKIRAYTHWMRNFSEAPLFEKNIAIYNARLASIKWDVHTRIGEGPSADTLLVDIRLSNADYAPIMRPYDYVFKAAGMKRVKGSSQTDSNGHDVLRMVLDKNNRPDVGEVSLMIPGISDYQTNVSLLASAVHLTLFPEGGNMVDGIRQRIAFKITDEKGSGLHGSGELRDSQGRVVAAFSDFHLGMGAFVLTPSASETYTAQVTVEDGRTASAVLPKAFASGYVMETHFAEQNDSIRFHIRRHGFAEDTRVGLMMQSGGKVLWTGKLRMAKDSVYLAIGRSALPSGVLQFTLFQTDGEPLCERLVFVNHDDAFNIQVQTSKKGYGKRERIAMELSVTDHEGKPVQGSFSVSVTDTKQVSDTARYQGNLLTHMLLTSEIKGYIEQPGYYFEAQDVTQRKALEYLLMTQGWRRYRWEQALQKQFVIQYPAEKGLTITGTVQNITTHKPMPDHEVTLLIQNKKDVEVGTAVTSWRGRFRFFPNFYGEARVTLQTKNKKDKLIERRIELEEETFIPDSTLMSTIASTQPADARQQARAADQQITKTYQETYSLVQDYLDEQDSIMRVYEIGAAEVHAKEILTPTYTKVAEKVINVGTEMNELRNDLNFRVSNILEFLYYTYPERFAEIPTDSGSRVVYLKGRRMDGGYRDLIYLVNDMAVDPELILAEDVMCYERIEVVDQSGLACMYVTGDYDDIECMTAVVVVIQRRPDGSCAEMNTGIKNYVMQGYAIAKEFYSPDYNGRDRDSAMPDIRSTIYWNPNVVTGTDGKATINFYQNDMGNPLKAKIEGISLSGFTGIGSTEYNF